MGTTHVMNAGLVPLAARTPALVAAAGARASYRFFEFFGGAAVHAEWPFFPGWRG